MQKQHLGERLRSSGFYRNKYKRLYRSNTIPDSLECMGLPDVKQSLQKGLSFGHALSQTELTPSRLNPPRSSVKNRRSPEESRRSIERTRYYEQAAYAGANYWTHSGMACSPRDQR